MIEERHEYSPDIIYAYVFQGNRPPTYWRHEYYDKNNRNSNCEFYGRYYHESVVEQLTAERDALKEALRVVAFNEEDLLASEIAEMAHMILRQQRAVEAQHDE